MRHLLIALFFALFARPADALCEGPTIDARLTGAEQAELAQRVADTAFANGLIWRATKGQSQIILVGTFHLADPRNDALLDRIAPFLAATDQLLVEVTPEGEAEVQRHLAGNPDLLLLPDNGTLITQLPPDLWSGIAAAAKARGIPPFMAARFQPWYLTMSLSIPTCAMPSMLAGERGLDGKIMELADQMAVPVAPVEDWRTALAILMQGEFDDQLAMLELALMDPDLQAEAMASMIEHYYKGELAMIWELNRITARWTPGLSPEQAEAMFDDFSQGLLVDRNRAWMPVILQAADETPRLMVAVGAAHLPGPDGVLTALGIAGWTVERAD